MQSTTVTICESVEKANELGFNTENKYKDIIALDLKESVIVKNGTIGGNSTIDLILVDSSRKQYVAIVTANILKSIAQIS